MRSARAKHDFPPAAPWERLRAWIDEKQAWEKANNHKAELSKNELTAISQLVPFVVEPDVSDADYVSRLQMHLQGNKMQLPTFSDRERKYKKFGLDQQGWLCTCTIYGIEGEFPRQGYGVEEGEDPPTFQNKKTAKQYAAKQALTYLTGRRVSSESSARRHMSAEHFRGGNASTPVPQASSAFQTPQSVRIKPEPDNDSPYSPSLGQISRAETPMSDISTGAPPPTSASARPVGSEVGIFNAVSTLANRLGLDQPTYEVQPDGDEAGIFRGRARFRLGAKVPENIGEVRDVNGKILAKTLIAEQVLSWLQEEDRIRQQTIASMLGRVGGAPETGNMEV